MKRNELLNPEEYKNGFYYIPGYRNYAINENGDVLHITENRLLVQTNGRPYLTVSLPEKENSRYKYTKQFRVHRLVALTFLSTGEFRPGDLQVNHKDRNTYNNHLSNLEWVTPSENVEHAIATGLYNKNRERPVQVRNYITGELSPIYPTLKECALAIDIHKDSVFDRLKLGPLYMFPEGYQYRDKDFDKPWPVPTAFDTTNYFDFGTKKAVLVREWKLNGFTTRFESSVEAANYIGIAPSTLSVRLDKNNQVMMPGLVEVKFDDGKPWNDTIDPWLALQRDFPATKVVQVIDTINNKTYIYESIVECAKSHNLKPSTLSERIRNNDNTRKVFSDGCRYGYYPFK